MSAQHGAIVVSSQDLFLSDALWSLLLHAVHKDVFFFSDFHLLTKNLHSTVHMCMMRSLLYVRTHA